VGSLFIACYLRALPALASAVQIPAQTPAAATTERTGTPGIVSTGATRHTSSNGTASLHGEPRDPRPGQLALTVGVPQFRGEFLRGELTVDLRYGYKLWWLVPYVAGGFRQVRLDPLDWPWMARDKKLRAWHATLGVRIELPASQKLLPFLGIAIERTQWSYTEDSTSYCHESYYPDSWRCYQSPDHKFGTAIKPQFGFLYKPEPSLTLEFWVEYVRVDAPEMFTRTFTFVHPALGLAWHH